LALLLGACAIPDIEVVDSLDRGSGGSTSKAGAANQAGTKSPSNQGGIDSTEGGAGPGGESSEGGTNNNPGGGTPTGGNPPLGGNSPTGGGGGSGGAPPKNAVAKFCNAVVIGGEVIDLDLRIGSGSSLVHLVAESGTCSPTVGRACQAIPSGASVPVEVYDLDDNVIWSTTLRIAANSAWIFAFYFDEDAQEPGLSVESNGTASECSATDFDDLFPSAPSR
jgi:hypothetical protein